jgi:ribosomal-protein-alanine N-acetyltransferase
VKKPSCELFSFCGGASPLCRGSHWSCSSECPPAEVCESIGALERLCFPPVSSWSTEQISGLLQEGASLATVVLVERRIVGYALYRSVPPESELLRIAIDPRFQGEGYGRLLIEDGLSVLGSRGVSCVFLEVASKNEAALALYRAAKFLEIGRRENYYEQLSDDAIVMKRDINAMSYSDSARLGKNV